MTYITGLNNLAANLSTAIFNAMEDAKRQGHELTQHQLNLLIGGWMSDNNCTVIKRVDSEQPR